MPASFSSLLKMAVALLPAVTFAHANPQMEGPQHLPLARQAAPAIPKNYGMMLFRAVDMQDVFGPLAILQLLAHLGQPLNLHMIAETLAPVTTETEAPAMNPANATFWPLLLPDATFADDLDLDVLIVPGGPGMRAENVTVLTDYIVRMFPKVKHMITICTGSGLAARSGVLDGLHATTNKRAWAQITAMGPKVKWVSPARWVVDGKLWTSSGVTSGLDLTFEFVKQFYGVEYADRMSGIMEYERRPQDYDPFSPMHSVAPTNTDWIAKPTATPS